MAKLSECIASRGGNILNADIFVPEKKNVFYARRFPTVYILCHLVYFVVCSYFVGLIINVVFDYSVQKLILIM